MRPAFPRLVRAFPIALTAAVVFAVPSRATEGPPPQPTTRADGLDGRKLVAARVVGRELVEGTELTLSFHDGLAVSNGGCNDGVGDYLVKRGRLHLSNIDQQLQDCGAAKSRQEDWLLDVIDDAHVSERGNRLILRKGSVAITFIPALDPDRPDAIVGSWRLSGYKSQGERLRGLGYRSDGERDRAGLYLSDRIASVQSPCADARPNIRIRQVAATVTFLTTDASWETLDGVPRCSGARAKIDRVMRAVLRGRVRVQPTADVLTVRRAGSALRFERVRAADAS